MNYLIEDSQRRKKGRLFLLHGFAGYMYVFELMLIYFPGHLVGLVY